MTSSVCSGLATLNLFFLATTGCGKHRTVEPASTEAPPVLPKPPLPVCLVLSVGAHDGLAHIGVIRAMQENGVPIDCVVGTSMGAMVGGLYSFAPENDPGTSYQGIAKSYEEMARSEAGGSMLFGALVGGLLVAASGGAATPVVLGAAGGGTLGGSSVRKADWNRLRSVLHDHYGGATVESLPVRFGTVYQQASAAGLATVPVSSGVLAEQVASSIANPLIFTDLSVSQKQKLDPGADQVSAIPVEAACELFPGRQLVVSSVVGERVFTSPRMKCPYQLILVDPPEVDPGRAMQALEPEFGELIKAGYGAALTSVDWSLLPNRRRPAAPLPPPPKVHEVRVRLVVNVSKTKSNGNAWDAFGGLPEIRHNTSISACEGCDGYGTSASLTFQALVQDTFHAEWDLGALKLREGFIFHVKLTDQDLSDHDPIGTFELEFREAGKTVSVIQESTKVSLVFSSP